MGWAINQQIVKDQICRHVLLCIANYADQSGQVFFPEIFTLSKDTGLSESSVERAIQMLINEGLLFIPADNYQPILSAFVEPGNNQHSYQLDI